MGTQSQDPTTQKQSTPGNPGSSQEQARPPQDPKRRPPEDRPSQQGKDVGQAPTNHDDIEANPDDIEGGEDDANEEDAARPS